MLTFIQRCLYKFTRLKKDVTRDRSNVQNGKFWNYLRDFCAGLSQRLRIKKKKTTVLIVILKVSYGEAIHG